MSTDKTRLKSRPATRADIEKICGGLPAFSVRAWALDIDGEVAGVAGYHMIGNEAVVFSDAIREIPKSVIWRESVKLMNRIRVPAKCVAAPGSGPFLERLGWQFVGQSEDGDVYSWQN